MDTKKEIQNLKEQVAAMKHEIDFLVNKYQEDRIARETSRKTGTPFDTAITNIDQAINEANALIERLKEFQSKRETKLPTVGEICHHSIIFDEHDMRRNQFRKVADYVNDGWQPDWSTQHKNKFYIEIYKGEINICAAALTELKGVIYFKSDQAAKDALEIFGEDNFRKL
jgi:hypothetical protein